MNLVLNRLITDMYNRKPTQTSFCHAYRMCTLLIEIMRPKEALKVQDLLFSLKCSARFCIYSYAGLLLSRKEAHRTPSQEH